VLVALETASGIPAGAPKVGIVCTTSPTNTFDLVAKGGTIQTPDGNTVFMWSYANGAAPDNGSFQYPGPVLCVNQGSTVTINLTNSLPEPTSVAFPGQDAQVTASGGAPGLFTREAAASGGTVTYKFTASQPGTYLYESGTSVAKQVEMGLYGALIVRPTLGGGYAYGDAATQFDPAREFVMLLGEIDPVLHHAVETNGTYDFTTLHNRYFTINGRSFPDTIQDNGSSLLPTQPYGALIRIQPNTASNTLPALVRVLNAGVDNHPFHPHGNHTREIAQDGRLLTAPGGARASTERFGETIGAGQTKDYLLRWDDPDKWNPVTKTFPVPAPNYLDVVFKDSHTWYSGSPYLGYKGTLPAGTVSQNICGEWYFPLHSHALNEFTNFDEGFGGMGTTRRLLQLPDVDHAARWRPQERQRHRARRGRRDVLPGEPEDDDAHGRDGVHDGHHHAARRQRRRLPGHQRLLRARRQRGSAGDGGCRNDHLDDHARTARHRRRVACDQRDDHRARHGLVGDICGYPARRRRSEGHLQG
jgi:hypothetical protein